MGFEQLADYCNLALTWIGFGTVIGLVAKVLMPTRDPGGSIATVLMGIVGTLVGCVCLQSFSGNELIEPVSVRGFIVGCGGAFVILAFYQVLGGYWFVEGEQTTYRRRRTRRRSRVYED